MPMFESDTEFDYPPAAPAPVDSNRVYTYTEQMPALPGASGIAGIVTALKRRVLVPPAAPDGRVFVQFVVDKNGAVSQARIVKGLRADVDSAVVAATRQLPRFTPGKQGGRAVPVSFTVAVIFPLPKQ